MDFYIVISTLAMDFSISDGMAIDGRFTTLVKGLLCIMAKRR